MFELSDYKMSIEISNKMDPKVLDAAENVLYNIWYSIAEKLFKRVVEVTQLNQEQEKALKTACLRPNDFRIRINGILDIEQSNEDEAGVEGS